MLGVNESMRRDKQDTMMTFIILKMLYDAINKEEVRQRAEEFLLLGRVKLVDQALYEMARKRRSKKECPTESSDEEVGAAKPPSAAEQNNPPATQTTTATPPKAPGQRATV